MAKRKRNEPHTRATLKKQKPNKSKIRAEFEDIPDGFWPIKAIRGEKCLRDSELSYLVEWAEHPETRETYPLEWVGYRGTGDLITKLTADRTLTLLNPRFESGTK